jgi:hypothetical protein
MDKRLKEKESKRRSNEKQTENRDIIKHKKTIWGKYSKVDDR